MLGPSDTAFGWMINPYIGCRHGCKYCYGMATQSTLYDDWLNAKPRKSLIERLKADIKKLKKLDITCGISDIFIGSITDSYQPLEAEYKQTRQVIEVLQSNELPFSILTKSTLVLRDIDLFKGYKWCRVGTTITSFDETFRKDLEPFTATYDKRIEVLKILKANGISTYLSGEPIMPIECSNPLEIISKLRDCVDLFDFGLYTNKGRYDCTPEKYKKHFKDIAYHVELFNEAIQYCKKNNVAYSNSSHSEKFFKENNLPFVPYPQLKPVMPKAQQLLTVYCY